MSPYSKKLRSVLLHSVVPGVLLSLGVGSAAQAQIETVVVTAEKRAENIQSVPIAITAFTGATLQDKNITNLQELSNLTPNVNLDAGSPFSGDTSVLSASIRGIGQDDFAFNLDPGVGVYVDGVYLARTIGANVDLLDVSRIEVLKGPQGTLFGRNTIGGAINIVTRDPGDVFMLEGEVTTGSFNRRDINATADIPLAQNLLTSLTVSSVEQDGYQHQINFNNTGGWVVDPPTPHNGGMTGGNTYGGLNHFALRGKAVWTLDQNFNVVFEADWTHQDQESIPNTVLQSYPNTPGAGGSIAALYSACLGIASAIAHGAPITYPPAGPTAALCTQPRAQGWPPNIAGLPPLSSETNLLPIEPYTTMTGNIDTTYANGPDFAKNDVEGAAVTATWTLNDSMTLKSITGFRHITWNIGIDLDGSIDNGEFLSVTDKQQQTQWTQEFQLLGTAFGARLNYVAGIYFFHEDGFVHDWVPFDGSLLAVDDGNLNLLNTNSYAGYVHADYKVTDQLGITLGGRYSVDVKSFYGGQMDDNGLSYKASGCNPPTASGALIGAPAFLTCQQVLGFPVAGAPYTYFPAGWNTRDFYEFTPTVSAQYHVTDDAMVYASWSKGFKSGGWTTRLSAPISSATQAQYDPEKATTTEVGLKSTWFDNNLLLNVAGFYTDYRSIQLYEQEGASPVLANLGNANIFGAEVESTAVLGEGFMVHGNIGYLDAYYTQLLPAAAGAVTLQSHLPKTPKWKVNLNPEYTRDMGNGQAFEAQLSYTHVSSLYNDSLNTPLLERPSLDLLDMSVQYSFANGKYVVQIGGTNITDKRYITTGSVNYAAGFVDGTYNPPAEWYATFRVKL
ncbi:MAG TPA: TonB-dependent receptor [Rhizomicrobium sp.]|nr:TonB-dependent receptor [Rhizomicrobium sp.]